MATGGSFSGGSGEDWKDFLTCSLCLEIFRSPKLLPCHHSFCLPCLENLASRHRSGSFPCPQCRRDVTVPFGGVAAFQSNFHVNPKDLEKARNEAVCRIHPRQDMNLYCVDCQRPVCQICALTNHKQHVTEEMDKAARRAMQQLNRDEDRLQNAVYCVKNRVKAKKTRQQSMQDKKSAMQKVIRRKQAWLKSMVDKYCEDSLASLTALSEDWHSCLTKDLDCEQESLDQLCQLRQHVQEAIRGGEGFRVVSVAKEMMEGPGSPQAVSQLMSSEENSICWPVLDCKVAEDAFMPLVRDYFGHAKMMECGKGLKAEVEVMFCCGKEEENVEVFSLCPYDDGSKTVYISFARRGVKVDVPSETFDEKGKHVDTMTAATGKRSFKYRGDNKGIHVKHVTETCQTTCSKSLQEKIFKLKSDLSNGTADIQTMTVVSEHPLNTFTTTLFTICSGPHRAFDVNSSEQLYVVLEESGPVPDMQRKVRLYHRGKRDAVATYRPPSAACRPSDVCFWREPSGREILVVADEGTDSLHVVYVWDNQLSFEAYLAPGSPLITQPTALNTDTRGRLWVALRGGQIITVSDLEEQDIYRSWDYNFIVTEEESDIFIWPPS